MKKSVFVVFVLVASIMLMGAGYAYWTDQIVINNNVTTGNLEVKIDKPTADEMRYFSDPSYAYAAEYVQIQAAPTPDNKAFDVKIDNLYPGADATYVYTIKNTGTIPAVIDNINVVFDPSSSKALIDNMIFYSGFHKYNVNGDKISSDYTGAHPLNEMNAEYNSLLSGMRLEPGEYVVISIPSNDPVKYLTGCRLELLNTAPNEVENSNVSFSINANFKQHNQ